MKNKFPPVGSHTRRASKASAEKTTSKPSFRRRSKGEAERVSFNLKLDSPVANGVKNFHNCLEETTGARLPYTVSLRALIKAGLKANGFNHE